MLRTWFTLPVLAAAFALTGALTGCGVSIDVETGQAPGPADAPGMEAPAPPAGPEATDPTPPAELDDTAPDDPAPDDTALDDPAPDDTGEGSYTGTTDGQQPVTFTVAGGEVVDFTAGISMFCTGSGYEFNAVIPPGPMAIEGGTFSYEGRDVTDGTDITVVGRLDGSTASGEITMSDSVYDAPSGMFHTCSGSATFSAQAT